MLKRILFFTLFLAATCHAQTGVFPTLVAVSSTTSLGSSQINYLCEVTTSTSTLTLTLPANSTNASQMIFVKKMDSAAGSAVVTGAGSDKIDGAATFTLNTQYQFLWIIADGLGNWNIVDTNIALIPGTAAMTGAMTTIGTVNESPQYIALTSSFTTSATGGNGTLQAITGLSFTLTASVAQNVPIHCHLGWSQATNVADQIGVSVSVAVTRMDWFGWSALSATTGKSGSLVDSTSSTSSQAVIAVTPTVATELWAELDGYIQNPSTTANTVQIYFSEATQADVIVVAAGSWCRIY